MDEKEPTPTTEQVERGSGKIAPPAPPKTSKKHRQRADDAAARQRARKRSGEDD